MRHLLAAIAALLMMSGCGSPSGDSSGGEPEENTWDSPGDYRYDLDSSCGEQALIGEFRITVANDEVVDVDALDDSAEALLQSQFADVIPTIDELLAMADRAEADGAEVVDVSFGPDGVPKSVEFDYNLSAVDDESCFVITNFKPAKRS